MNLLHCLFCSLFICLSSFATAQIQPIIYYVNSTQDNADQNLSNMSCADFNGNCTLRAAIQQANANGGNTVIRFSVNTPATFSLNSELPPIIAPFILIDASYFNYQLGDIILNGFDDHEEGLVIKAENCTIRGLYIKQFSKYGIQVSKVSANTNIEYNALNNNGTGLYIESDNTAIFGNYIGLDPIDALPEGNEKYGIELDGDNQVIYANLGEDGANLICSNGGSGLYAHGRVDIFAKSNYFGTRENRDINRPNGTTYGVGSGAWLDLHASSTGEFDSNVFYYNDKHGIRLGANTNNYFIHSNEFRAQESYGIWLDEVEGGIVSVGNSISKNIFVCNGEGSIRLMPNANENIAPPKILYIQETSFNKYEIAGTATPNATIEIYINKQACTQCEGEVFYGTTISESDGTWMVKDVEANIGDIVTTTATTNQGSTSEFSNCKTIIQNNDEPCINDITALQIELSEDMCDGEIACASTYFATDSSPQFGDPLEDCNGNPTLYSGQDIWFTTVMPSTNNLLLRQRSGTDINAVVEVYAGDCFQQLQIITCETFYLKPDYLVLKGNELNLSKGERIYFRVYNAKTEEISDEGNIALSAHILPDQEDEWIFCDSEGASFDPKQFIVIMEPKAKEGDIEDLINEMINDGAALAGRCKCAPQQMILFDNESYVEMEKRGKTSSNRARVDTTSYNYFIEDFFQDGQGTAEKLTGDDYDPTDIIGSTKVAIVDTGVDEFHPKLQKAIWQNTDVGGNCVPDDYIGFDFKNDQPDPIDIDGHGTAVNGIVAFDFPNNLLLELINPKFFENNKGKLFNAVCGTYYAINQEAATINLSWGLVRDEVPAILNDVLLYAAQHDIVVITSAGNKGENNDEVGKFPANLKLDNMITVAAFENAGDTILPDYSNYGKAFVDIAAQGTAESTQYNSEGLIPHPGDISTFSGTSIATPFVSQTSAIIRATFPHLSAEDVVNCILSTATFHNNFVDKVKTNGFLDQAAALQCAATLPALPIASLSLEAKVRHQQNVQLNWQQLGEAEDEGVFYIYRSTDGKQWLEIGQKKLDVGQKNYQFIDHNLLNHDQYFYQIKWIKNDKYSLQSNIQQIDLVSANTLLCYPNPVQKGIINIVLPTKQSSALLQLTDLSGQVILSKKANTRALTWQLPNVPIGIYLLVVAENGNLWRKKLVITSQ